MQIALRNAVPKIIVFLLSVMLLIVILGTIMYIFEGLGGIILDFRIFQILFIGQ